MIWQRAALPTYLALCIILGGASAGGYWANGALQLLGCALLFWAIWSTKYRPVGPERWLIGFLIAIVVIALLQLLPLPTALWYALSGRADLVNPDFAELLAPASFVSLKPHESLKSIIWLIPPIAVGFFMIRLRPAEPHILAAVLATMTLLSVLVGALQLKGGRDSDWYIYEITNRGSTVGFFANSNHLATLLLIALPFLAAIAKSFPAHRQGAQAVWVGCGAVALVCLVGIYQNGSLAGYGLVFPVLAASAMIFAPRGKLRGIALFAITVMAALGIWTISMTTEGQAYLAPDDTLSLGSRSIIFARTVDLIGIYFPLGSGLGTFQESYRALESLDVLELAVVNHAHNDYLEIIAETGIMGLLVLAVFIVWWLMRAIRIWRARYAEPVTLAAVIASGIVLIHSTVDYPLRTAAISTIFVLCLVLMCSWVSDDPVSGRQLTVK